MEMKPRLSRDGEHEMKDSLAGIEIPGGSRNPAEGSDPPVGLAGDDRHRDLVAAFKTALIYIGLGGSWILFSDRLLPVAFPDSTPQVLSWLQTFKGWFYVGATGALAFFLVRHNQRRIRRSEDQVRRHNEELLAINRLVSVCAGQRESRFLPNEILEEILALVQVNGGFLFRGESLESMVVVAGLDPARSSKEIEASSFPLIARPLCARCIERREILVYDLADGGVDPEITPVMAAERLSYIAIFPLESQGQILGGVVLFSRNHDRPEPRRLQVLETVSAQVALAMENARLLEEIRHQARTLETRVDLRTRELQAINQELEAFSYSVSHDLRAPLRAIQGFSSILKEDHAPHLNPEACQLIDTVQRNAQRMSQLINDLLAFSRLTRQRFECQEINMNNLVKQALDELSPLLKGRSIDLRVSDLPAVKGDRSLLLQVWLNLLGNAIKFTTKRDPAWIAIEAQSREDEVVFRVRDNGAGFDMKYADRLFKVFQRLHSYEEFEGTGAGLAWISTEKN